MSSGVMHAVAGSPAGFAAEHTEAPGTVSGDLQCPHGLAAEGSRPIPRPWAAVTFEKWG